MEKININQFSKNNFNKKSDLLSEITQHVRSNTGMELKSIKYSNNKIIAKAHNNYEAIEIRMKLQKYLEMNNVKVL